MNFPLLIVGAVRKFGYGVRFSSSQQAQLLQQELLVSRVGEQETIVQLTLNRPAARNAFNKSLCRALERAVGELREDRTARVVVIGSSVPRVFSAGADLKERASFTQQQVVEFVDGLRDLFGAVAALPVPVIAAIEGAALGGGLELALAADMRVATSTSQLGLPETRLAIIPGAGGTQRLPRLISPALAAELIYTGRIVSGIEAQSIGLVNHVVESGALERALQMAEQIANNGPCAVRAAKRAISQGAGIPIEEALNTEKASYATIVPTQDRIEGLLAFKEKRRPYYTGQ